MDFRESCISSFFVHVMAILLLAAVSQVHMSQPASMVVSLSSDTFEKTSKAEEPISGEMKEVASPELPMASEEETIEKAENPEDANAVPEEKPAIVPEEEKTTENPQMAGTVPPLDMIELARMKRIIAIHKRAFVETASQSVQKALHKEIAGDPSGGLNEGTAEIALYFNEKGGIREVWGGSVSEKLQAALARLDWRTIPSPADFKLRMNGLRVSIKIERGEPTILFSAI
jgi:hypothetical protein